MDDERVMLIAVSDGTDGAPLVLDPTSGPDMATLMHELRESRVRTTEDLLGAVALYHVVPGTKLMASAHALVEYLSRDDQAWYHAADILTQDGTHIVRLNWSVDRR